MDEKYLTAGDFDYLYDLSLEDLKGQLNLAY